MADAALGGSGAPVARPSKTTSAAAVPSRKKLTAIVWGSRVTVRVVVSGRDVSAPSSSVEDNDEQVEDANVSAADGRQGIERTSSGSTARTDVSMDREPTSAKTGEEKEDSVNSASGSDAEEGGDHRPHTRRASAEEPALTRENSSSSEPRPLNSNDAGGAEGGSSNFEASLLLGIAESTSSATSGNVSGTTSEKERREPHDPATLPTSMTSFLDMLTEDQRRVRHRHIPGVEGFRKLYRSEVKSDMSEARKMKRAKKERESSKEADGEEGDETKSTGSDGKDGGDKEERIPERDAFVVPGKEVRLCANSGQLAGMIESIDFESAVRGGGGGGGVMPAAPTSNAHNTPASGAPSLRSPRLVDSLTSFDPPRPQESTSSKTKHRLRRWEARPHEVDSDLANYRRTVARTREELHKAGEERARIEAGASLVRGHFANHLDNFRREMLAMNEQWQAVNGNCLKLEEECNGRSMSTRGTTKGMKDVLVTLKALGQEVNGIGPSAIGKPTKDWRGEGVGGVSSKRGKKNPTASGWFLPGDDVIVTSSGKEGRVAYVRGPGEMMEQYKGDKTGEKKTNEEDGDAMDVDTTNKVKKGADKGKSSKISSTIGVKLVKSGRIQSFAPSQVTFNPNKLPTLAHSDAALASRWEAMIQTALSSGADHDVLAMEEHIHTQLAKERAGEEDAAAGIVDGTAEGARDNHAGGGSPKSVTKFDDGRAVLPFGAGLFAASADVRDYPSLIPLETMEESVRRVVYEEQRPRVIPTMSEDVETFEAQQEEINQLKGKVMQLRNRLSRQKKLRSLNERSLVAGKSRAHKVEGLLLEMQMDLRTLKERLQDELNEIGIGNSPVPLTPEKGADDNDPGILGDETLMDKEEEPAMMANASGHTGDVPVGVAQPDSEEGAGGASHVEEPMTKFEEEVKESLPRANEKGAEDEYEREMKHARVEEV
eukprot:CAMPEP_0172554910 /NCGR_PEP_ID=MMETSP1067-20121228/56996_1 /TAXON_ID=265564 ORGANISM="Thalassiosira punctigera, Strain Tpunct2005C2" /NCGR_SAMPLE_ID=MMETSP1067 /ASSEMBLY_ACC=CAM_ASM_000444 /LENGTH=941 /DNA_ID=CAMNT_0013343377 /DNA_START=227 /DNA_END=3052 /DNA_ORIENTATION=-